MTMADVLVMANVFQSKSQARKSGIDLTIPKGFTDVYRGKLKTRITILNLEN